MKPRHLSLVLSVARTWHELLPGPQAGCAFLQLWYSGNRSPASTSASTSKSSSSSSSSNCVTDDSAHAIYTASSSRAVTVSAHDALATSAAAAVQAQHGVRQLLPPLSSADLLPRLVRCKRVLTLESLHLSHWLGNPLVAAAPGTKVLVSFSLTVHPSDWDPDDYVISCARQLGGNTGASDVTFSANARRKGDGRFVATVRAQDRPDGYNYKRYDVVLQEQLEPAAFRLHLKPHTPDSPKHPGQAISPAGQGLGLQVFPGSIPAVDCEGTTVMRTKEQMEIAVPKALVISQLPPTTTFPADMTLIIKDLRLQGDQLDQHMTVRLHTRYRGMTAEKWPLHRIREHQSHPLTAYEGRLIIRMALTPDKQLTVYLAPAAAAS